MAASRRSLVMDALFNYVFTKIDKEKSMFGNRFFKLVLLCSFFSTAISFAAAPPDGDLVTFDMLSVAVKQTSQRLIASKEQSKRIRANVLEQAEDLMLQNPEYTNDEYQQLNHFIRAGLPGRDSDFATQRIMSATLAEYVERQREKHNFVAIDDLQFVQVGSTTIIAESDSRIVTTNSGDITTVKKPEKQGHSSPIGPDNTALADIHGPNVYHADFGGGGCPNVQKSNEWGVAEFCWWKYRLWDNSNSDDYWAYMGVVTAEPKSIPWDFDPYVRRARTASQMTSSSRSKVGYEGFTDFDPKTTQVGGKCYDVSVGVSGYGASASLGGIQFCDTWDQYDNKSTGYQRVQFDTGFFGEGGRDEEAAHASLSHTGQRPTSGYFPYWNDYWWASFCRDFHFNCK
jgi:hypothetical protein